MTEPIIDNLQRLVRALAPEAVTYGRGHDDEILAACVRVMCVDLTDDGMVQVPVDVRLGPTLAQALHDVIDLTPGEEDPEVRYPEEQNP